MSADWIRDETEEALATALGTTPAEIGYGVVVIGSGFRTVESFRTDGHDEAVAWAAERAIHYGAAVFQVTLDATFIPAPGAGTFATRHLHGASHYSTNPGNDSGWRCYRSGEFIGGLGVTP